MYFRLLEGEHLHAPHLRHRRSWIVNYTRYSYGVHLPACRKTEFRLRAHELNPRLSTHLIHLRRLAEGDDGEKVHAPFHRFRFLVPRRKVEVPLARLDAVHAVHHLREDLAGE